MILQQSLGAHVLKLNDSDLKVSDYSTKVPLGKYFNPQLIKRETISFFTLSCICLTLHLRINSLSSSYYEPHVITLAK